MFKLLAFFSSTLSDLEILRGWVKTYSCHRVTVYNARYSNISASPLEDLPPFLWVIGLTIFGGERSINSFIGPWLTSDLKEMVVVVVEVIVVGGVHQHH